MRLFANVLLSSVGLTLVFAPAALANWSRVNAMGGDDRLLLDDNTIRYRFPNQLANYHDVNVEDGAGFSIVHEYGDATVGAMHDADAASTNWLNLMYGNATWGVIVELDHQSDGEDLPGYDGAWATFGTEVAGGDFAIGGGFFSDDPGGGGDAATGFDAHANFRGADGFSSWVNLGPMGEVTFESVADDHTTLGVEAGIGGNHTFGTSGTVVCGLFVGFTNWSPDVGDAISTIVLPDARVGAEYDVANWFSYDVTLRAGAGRMTAWSDGAVTHTYMQNFGFGIGNDRVSIDGVLHDDVLRDGPYIVGGEDNGLFTQLSVTIGLD